MKPASKAKSIGNLFAGLDEHCREYCQRLLDRTVKPTTAANYRNLARIVSEEGGDCGYFGFIKHCVRIDARAKAGYTPALEALLKEPREPRLATQTLRARKSACLHVCLCEGVPWSEEQSWAADRFLDGRASDDDPVRPRVALSAEQIDTAIAAVMRVNKDCGEGLEVMYAACLRSQDVRKMDASWVNLDPRGADKVPTCMSLRKTSERSAIAQGAVTYNPIVPLRDGRAMKILRRRAAEQREGIGCHEVLFPGWDEALIAKVLKKVAEVHQWEGRIDGTHNFRHSAAREAHQTSLLEVLRRGQWHSESAAVNYAVRSSGRQPANLKTPNVVAREDEYQQRVAANAIGARQRAAAQRAGKKTKARRS